MKATSLLSSSLLSSLALLACLAHPAAAAEESACPSQEAIGLKPTIEVQTVVPAAQFRNDVSRGQLTKMMRQQGSNGGSHATTLGLTVGTYHTVWTIEAVPRQHGNLYCHYLKHADIRLQVPTLVVYIGSEYRQGSCQFSAITKHENEHVRVNQYVVQKYAPMMKKAVTRQAQKILPIQSTSPTADREIERALSPTVLNVLKEMYAERDRGNAGIDTDYQYKRFAEQCAKW